MLRWISPAITKAAVVSQFLGAANLSLMLGVSRVPRSDQVRVLGAKAGEFGLLLSDDADQTVLVTFELAGWLGELGRSEMFPSARRTPKDDIAEVTAPRLLHDFRSSARLKLYAATAIAIGGSTFTSEPRTSMASVSDRQPKMACHARSPWALSSK